MPELTDKLDEARGVRVPPRRCRKACWLKCSHKSALMASERARTTVQLGVVVSRLPNVRLGCDWSRIMVFSLTKHRERQDSAVALSLPRLRLEAPFGQWGRRQNRHSKLKAG